MLCRSGLWARLLPSTMLLIGVAWAYVVLMVVLVQATGPDASWLGALATLLFWGVLPLGIVGYLALAPARRRRRRGAESAAASKAVEDRATFEPAASASAGKRPVEPDRGGHPPGDAVASERKEP